MSKDKVYSQIFQTTDYSKFKVLLGNRDINERHVKTIENSYEKIGQLDLPILVNEKMEVIEGQHRLQACKNKGLPVYYTIQEGLGLEECQALNISSANWKLDDYIDSYAKQGVTSYLFLKQLGELHPWASLNDKAAALFRLAKMSGSMIKKGNLEINERQLDIAHRTLNWVGPIMSNFTRTDFKGARCYLTTALCLCYQYSLDSKNKINLARLEQIVVDKLDRSIGWSNTDSCMESLEACYNHGLKKGNRFPIYSAYRNDKYFN